MRAEFIDPARILAKVDWPEVEQPAEELQKLRNRLVYLLVDRVNREGTTPENATELRKVRASIRALLNPNNITGFMTASRTGGKVTIKGKHDVVGYSKRKPTSPDKEIQAVLQALATEVGEEIDSVMDF